MKKLIYTLLTLIIITGFSVTSILAESNLNSLRINISNERDDIETLVKNAFELYKQKKYEEALAMCAKAQKLSPTDFRPNIIIGFIYFEQKKYKSASEEFGKSISLKPTVQGYMFKASADEQNGDIEQAISSYRKAIELEPKLAEAYWAIGEILIKNEKRRDEAISAYQSAVKLNPQFNLNYEYLGENILNIEKDEKLAEYVFRKQIAADEKKMTGRFALGRLLVKQGRLKEARELWEGRTSDKDNTLPGFIIILTRAEKLKQATDELAKKPTDPEALLQMGFAVMDGDSWVSDGRQEKAIEYFKKALTLKPNFAPAHYGICKAYIEIASIFTDKNKDVDAELVKLKKLDAKLAQEIEEYRKIYFGGFKVASPVKPNQ
jgi:tetratricopeptide (TPR) repeat protein